MLNLKSGGGNQLEAYDQYGKYTSAYDIPPEQTTIRKKAILTDAQSAAIRKGDRTIRDHLRKSEYQAVKIEINGGKIYRKDNAGTFDHIHEVKDGLRSLEKCIRKLEGSLRNPNLEFTEQFVLLSKIRKFKKIQEKFKRLFNKETI